MEYNNIYNTGETEEELRSKYNPDGSLMRNIQMRLLDMLLYFDSVCKEIGITYYIDGGTCLGAVRHKGFVPWDDDLDVVIDQKDYPKLCEYMISHPHPQYILHNHHSDPNYYLGWPKLRDKNSTSTYDNHFLDGANQESILKYKGVAMDIFLYSDHVIPMINYALHWIHKHITLMHLIKNHKIAAQCMYFLCMKILKPLANFTGLLFSRKKYYGHDYCGNNVIHRFLKDRIFPLKPIIFEGHEFMIPKDHDYFLSTLYGKWETLPPPSARGHHGLEYTIMDETN